jgi:hypothetical protein
MGLDYIAPVLEKTTQRDDALDHKTIPNERCDLNYRSRTARPAGAHLWSAIFGLAIPLAALPVIYLFQHPIGPAFTSHVVFLLFALVGIAIGLLTYQLEGSVRSMLLAAFIPIAIWLLAVIAPMQKDPACALLIMLVVAAPILLWLADAVATHAVYWMSAFYKIDHATMLAWREDWKDRFSGIPDRLPRRNDLMAWQHELHEAVMAARAGYRNGIVWLAIALAVPGVIIFADGRSATRDTSGFFLAVSLIMALVLGCVARVSQFPGSLKRTWFFLTDYLWNGSDRRHPPWVFQSPGGPAGQRCLLAGAALFLVGFTLLPLSDYFLWIFYGPHNSEVLPDSLLENPNGFKLAAGALEGNYYAGILVLAYCCLCVAAPGLVLFLAIHLVAGPAISAHYVALEGPRAYEQHPDWNRLDGYSERLRNSRNQKERNSLIVAFHPDFDYPVLMHLKLAFEHVLMLGPTGLGKTVLGMMTNMIQLIRRNDGTVVIIDCKGDDALFNTARIEAQRAGRKFKYFTNGLNKPTYVFNPFDKSMYSELSLEEIVGQLMEALNLHHGVDYAKAWFTIASRILAMRAFQETIPDGPNGTGHPKFPKIESFRDLNDIILFLAADGKQFQAAQHLAYVIESLSNFEQLNLTSKHPNIPAYENAINMSDAVKNNEVIYFYLKGAVDSVAVTEIGRLAIFSLLNACIGHKSRTGKRPQAHLLIDEAAHIVSKNTGNVLAQARSFGMACWFATQSMSQLHTSKDNDMREMVWTNVVAKFVFAARDEWLKKAIKENSGKVRYANLTYNVEASAAMNGNLDLGQVLENELGQRPVTITTYLGDRIGDQEIVEVNRDPNRCFLSIERAEAFSRWLGFAQVHVDWPLDERDYDRRDDESLWPAASAETITQRSPWPSASDETITTTPVITVRPSKEKQKSRLQQLKDSLDADE